MTAQTTRTSQPARSRQATVNAERAARVERDPAALVVGVVGAGTMGAGIAQVAALAGHEVLLLDAAEGRAAAAVAEIGRSLDRWVVRGRLPAAAAAETLTRLTAATSLTDLAPCCLVVEAVAERLDVKHVLMGALEGVVEPDCVLATNTSSLSITAIADGLEHPERLVGLHFFNPAPVMRLVEVVSGEHTHPAVAYRAAALAKAWGKSPVHVRSSPGFVVNRVARPFYGEALRALDEGVADAATLDAVLREGGGFPMGPLELTDLIGQDVNLATSRSVWEQRDQDPRFAPSPVQERLVAEGRLGRKTGQGFYPHGDDVRPPLPASVTAPVPSGRVVVRGDWGPWAPLWNRVRAAGVDVQVDRSEGDVPPSADLPGCTLVPTDGRTAAELSATSPAASAAETSSPAAPDVATSGEFESLPVPDTDRNRPLVEASPSPRSPVAVLDLVADAAEATRFAVALPPDVSPEVRDVVVGVLGATGAAVTVLPDRPGLLVARTVAMLADEAAATVADGVASAEDVDLAMRLGAGYPLGPLEWGDRVGAARVAAVLDAARAYSGDERYRVSEALREAAATGGSLRER